MRSENKNTFLGTVLKSVSIAALAGGIALAAPQPADLAYAAAQAQEDDGAPQRETRRTPAMRQNTFQKLEAAQLAQEEGNIEEAFEELEDLRDTRGLNSYETAMMWNFYAYLYYETEQYDQAITAYENVLAQPDLPLGFEDSVRFSLAQLHFVEENYEESIRLLEEWFRFAENPGTQAYIFLGQAYYALEQYENAIEPIQTAIDMSIANGQEPRENWYLLLRSIYYELKNFPMVREILETLVLKYDKADYWLQLASIYSELGMEDKQLAAMEVAYEKGFLTRSSHMVNLAQLFLYNSVPIKAAWVMEDGLEREIIEPTQDNYDLYSQALMSAKEYDEAEEPLSRAAQMSEDGDLYMRLAQVHVEQDDFDSAIAAVNNALEKGVEDEGQAYLLLGMANFNMENLEDALGAFRQARRDDDLRQQANQWIDYLERERERLRRLREAGL